jgi:hypothetical protein
MYLIVVNKPVLHGSVASAPTNGTIHYTRAQGYRANMHMVSENRNPRVLQLLCYI